VRISRDHPDAWQFFVVDLDNDTLIESCVWADDDEGVYKQLLRLEELLNLDLNDPNLLGYSYPWSSWPEVVMRGNIKIVHGDDLPEHLKQW
jgi:hypothetical protein